MYAGYWRGFGATVSSQHRTKILLCLRSPSTPKDLASMTGLYPGHVSSALKELVKLGLVVCRTPELRKGKLFELTDLGQMVANAIELRRRQGL
jgi:predicted transcriptional regulator